MVRNRRIGLGIFAAIAVFALAAVSFALFRTGDDGPDSAGPDATPSAPGATPTPTPRPASRILDCPVAQEICDFAVDAETHVRATDAPALIADGSPWDTPNDIGILKTSIERTLDSPAWPIRLASIGCPHIDGVTSCAEAFSLAFTTLGRGERNQPNDTGSLLVLGFQRRSGQEPALTMVGNPATADDIVYALTGGVSASCNLSGLPERISGECINTEFFAVEVERPVVAGQPPECPALAVVCETALKTEQAFRAGYAQGLTDDSAKAAALRTSMATIFGSDQPRLISVACPFGATRATCDGPFAVALTTLRPDEDWTLPAKMALVRFDWTPAGPVYADVIALEPVAAREAAIRGSIYGGTCGIAGIIPGQPCPGAVFVRYWSDEPFEPAGLPDVVSLRLLPAMAPPANTTIFTAAGPCWACDVPDEAILKHEFDASGKVTTTSVLDATQPLLAGWGSGQIAYAASDGSILAVTACRGGYCGALGSDKPVADWRVLWSLDRGESWRVAFETRGEYMEIASVSPAGLTVTVFDFDPVAPATTKHFSVLRDEAARERALPPDMGTRPQLVLLGGGKLAWVPLEEGHVVGGLRDLDGNPYPLNIPPGAENPVFGALPDGGSWATWYQDGVKLGIFAADGKLTAVYETNDGFRPVAVSESVGLATISLKTHDGSVPALLDFRARTIMPLGDPFGTDALPRRNRVLAVLPAP